MFNDIGERIDHAGDEHLIIVQRKFGETTKLMRVPRSCKWQDKPADLCLPHDRSDLFEGHVTIVRRL